MREDFEIYERIYANKIILLTSIKGKNSERKNIAYMHYMRRNCIQVMWIINSFKKTALDVYDYLM